METSPTTAELRPLVRELLADPARLDELVSALVTALRRAVPAYRRIPESSLRQGNRQIMVVALGHLAEGRLPTAAELREINKVGELRARQGLDLAAVLAAYHAAGDRFWAIITDRARQRGVSEAALTALTKLTWDWLHVATVAVATAHREVDLRAAREDEQRRGDALRTALLRPGPAAAVEQQLLQLGLDPTGHYVAFRGRLTGATVSAVREALGSGTASPDGSARQDVIGLADSEDQLIEALTADLGTFGVGRPEPAGRLHVSYGLASRALNAALRLRRPGASRLRDLRLAAVAATDLDLTEILTDRLLRPLRDRGRYGDQLWQTVVSYVEHGLRVDVAADELHIHANTLRHRLEQFARLTGTDLRDPADVAEVWWLATALTADQDP